MRPRTGMTNLGQNGSENYRHKKVITHFSRFKHLFPVLRAAFYSGRTEHF